MKMKYNKSMITEDMSAHSNMPQNVIMKEYSSYESGLNTYLDDGMSGIDKQMMMDSKKMKSQKSKPGY